MRITKGHHVITCVGDWKKFAPPKREDQWEEDRSACELARAWCGAGTVAMPRELRALFESHRVTRGMSVECATPELQISFDGHGGGRRNADLAFIGRTPSGRVAVTVEAKADETFDGTVADTLAAALERLVENPRSQGVRRVEGLVRALFVSRARNQAEIAQLRYQLLTATAGTLAYAIRHKVPIAVLVVHEFVTRKTSDAAHARNTADYLAFLARLSGKPPLEITQGGFFGPLTVPGAPLFATAPKLLIGKVTTRLRTGPR